MAQDVKLSLTLAGDASGAEEALEAVCAAAEAARSAVEEISSVAVSPATDASSLKRLSETAADACSAVDSVSGKADSLGDAADSAADDLEKAADTLDETADAADDAAGGLGQAAGAMKKVGARSATAQGKVRGLYQTMQREIPSLDKLKEAVPLGGLIASGLSAAARACKALATAAAAAGAAAAAAVVKFGADQEQTRLKMQVLLGDAAKGNKLMGQLSEMANATPFSTSDVVGAGQALLSYGVAAGDVRRALEQVGNAAAATGRPLGQMAEMYGKALAKGKADSETLNQMAGAGVPILQALAKQLGVSKEEVYGLAAAGKVSAGLLAAAFGSLSEQGGAFNGMMERQSQTVGGMWSTLTGKLQQAAGTLGEQLAPVMRKVLEWAISFADKLSAAVSDGTVVQTLGDWAQIGVTFFWELGRTANTVWQYIKAGALYLGDICEGVFRVVAAGAMAQFGYILQKFADMVNGFIWIYNAVARLGGFDQIDEVDWGDSMMESAARHGNAALDAGDRMSRRFTDAKESIAEYNRESEENENKINNLIVKGVHVAMKSIRDDAKAAEAATLETGGQATALLRGAVDEVAEPVAKAVSEEIENALEGHREKGEEARMEVFDLAGKSTGETTEEPVAPTARAPGETPMDSLARIGLYNFGAAADKSLDMRRNQLLERIAAGVWAPQSRMEVFAV